jgi:hypothetical protein
MRSGDGSDIFATGFELRWRVLEKRVRHETGRGHCLLHAEGLDGGFPSRTLGTDEFITEGRGRQVGNIRARLKCWSLF